MGIKSGGIIETEAPVSIKKFDVLSKNLKATVKVWDEFVVAELIRPVSFPAGLGKPGENWQELLA